MTALHAATNAPKAKEIVEVVLTAIYEIHECAANQAAGICTTKEEAANAAIYEVVEHLRDHLQIDIAVTLASWEIE